MQRPVEPPVSAAVQPMAGYLPGRGRDRADAGQAGKVVCPRFGGVVLLDSVPLDLRGEWRGTRGLDGAIRRSSGARCWIWSRRGRPVAEVAQALGISGQTISTWRRQDRIDRGLVAGLTSAEKTEPAVAKRRIAELETELGATRRAMELVREVVPQKGASKRS
jgi:transposase